MSLLSELFGIATSSDSNRLLKVPSHRVDCHVSHHAIEVGGARRRQSGGERWEDFGLSLWLSQELVNVLVSRLVNVFSTLFQWKSFQNLVNVFSVDVVGISWD